MNIKGFNNTTGKWEDLKGEPGATIGIDDTGTWTAQPYKLLIGTISQSGANSVPTVVEFYNTLGMGYTFNYLGAGEYNIVFDDDILTDRFWASIFLRGFAEITVDKPDTLLITSRDTSDNRSDDVFTENYFEFRIYPQTV
jgi:hypothetical protein